MKKTILILSIFLAVGFLAGRFVTQNQFRADQMIPTQIPRSTSTPQNLSDYVRDSAPKISREISRVKRVIDGDTIELDTGERLRYIGMDTSEVVDPRKPVQCFGVEARERNKELVEGKLVVLVKDISERDKYNRLLRYVWVGSTFINFELVKEGYATASTYPPDVAHAKEFVAAEKEAREAKRGLWKACPSIK